MIDFLRISTRMIKNGVIEIKPKFILPTNKKISDLMIRGGDFYAVWVEELKQWSTDEGLAFYLIDKELERYATEYREKHEDVQLNILYMWDSDSGSVDRWHKYCQKQARDFFHILDEKLVFSNTEPKKTDYSSKHLDYPLEDGDISAYDRLMSVLYSEEERHKIEWAIGSIVSGDSVKIQKFLVLYGAAGTGKSTVLNIIQRLFEGYYTVFDAKSLGSSNKDFALEPFSCHPLVAIQHDGDLSRIEDNTRLNSLVSHELMSVNTKFKSAYPGRFKCFLFMGTNKPVKITDAKSGLIRRLIDVSPTGERLKVNEYNSVMKQIEFELGAIAKHCLDVYKSNPGRYDNYIPTAMLGASNDFYNFVLDSYYVFKNENGTTLKAAWEMYKTYCEEARVAYPMQKTMFKEELKNYFKEFTERSAGSSRVRNAYTGFRYNIFEEQKEDESEESKSTWLEFYEGIDSVFDKECANCFAQYAKNDIPEKKWSQVSTTLKDLNTSKLHYVQVPENHIVIDFDLKDKNGNKSFERNVEAASKWPATYAELSKSGAGIHLHYIYTGDPRQLATVFDKDIEIKVSRGNSALRRMLSRCNDLAIATISSGLPLKGAKMIKTDVFTNEKGIRTTIKKNLRKEIHPGTKPSIDHIYKILEDAYNSGVHYDVSNMYNEIFAFAAQSSHKADYCLGLVDKMHFKSDDVSENIDPADDRIVFYDVEVMPNLFVVCWKFAGDEKVFKMINPSSTDIEALLNYRLVGFFNRKYDNHIIYARLMGYTNEQLYKLSSMITSGKGGYFGEAYNLSYTDVYDFCSEKQSLKKWEIELDIHHQELGLPWDQPVPEELWLTVADYCANDVIATEAVFNERQSDWTARLILADVADMTPNDTTNSLTGKIIFQGNKHPQDAFNYRNMGEITLPFNDPLPEDMDLDPKFTIFQEGKPIFPGYVYAWGKSTYRDEVVGEGGYVYAEPGIHTNIALLDIASMHPSSLVAENLFGDEYTQRFKEILDARISIKHGDFENAKKMLGGKLEKYLTDEKSAKSLAQALKIAINSVYGLTAAGFDNPFRDPRNVDNIVAKRGALFMVNLKHEVQKQGFTVAHIKTDSIKIPNATPEIIQFVMRYGKLYGYNFEHEATYDRMCLVNDAVYIAKYKDTGEWTATGTQFKVPYVFKTLFSKEKVLFKDICMTFEVKKGALYLDMNEDLPDVSGFEKELKKASEKYRKGLISDTTYEEIKADLEPKIEKGHSYSFIGRVGLFCPIKPGRGGGILYRYNDGKYYAATGTTGYRWLESELIKQLEPDSLCSDWRDERLNANHRIDFTLFDKMADEAIATINKYGNFEKFVSDKHYISDSFMNIPEDAPEEIPFDEKVDIIKKEK